MAVCLCFVFAALLEYACVNVLARNQENRAAKQQQRQELKLIQEQRNGVVIIIRHPLIDRNGLILLLDI